jgi:hypothetical protein
MPRSRGRVRGFPVETFLRRLRPTPIPYTSWLTGPLHRNRERPDPPSKARRAGTRPPRLRPRGTRHPPAPEVSLGLCERRRAGFARLSGWQSVGNWVASGANFPVSLLPVGVTPTTSRRIATRSFAPKNGQKPKPSGRLAYMSSAHRTGHKPSPRRGIFFLWGAGAAPAMEAWWKPALSKARVSRSNIAGRKAVTIGFPHWPQTSWAVMSRFWWRKEAILRYWRPSRQRRRYRSCSRSAATRSSSDCAGANRTDLNRRHRCACSGSNCQLITRASPRTDEPLLKRDARRQVRQGRQRGRDVSRDRLGPRFSEHST